MKQYIYIVLALIVIGCSSLKRSQIHDDTISNIEYTDAFTEALKQKILGNYNLAEELLLKCIKSRPYQAVNYYELSLIYLKLGETNKSLSYGLKAIKYDEQNEWFYLHLIKLYQVLDNKDSVIYCYKRIVKLKPYKVEYKMKLANLYFDYGYFKSSLNVLSKIDGENSLLGEIFLLRYKNYLALNNRRKSLETLKQAIKRLPYEVRFYGLIAEYYSSTGKKELALSFYKQLLKLDPNNEHGYLSLIDFYRSSNNYMQAYDVALNFVRNLDFTFENKTEVIKSYLDDNFQLDYTKSDILKLIDTLIYRYPDELKLKMLKIDFYIKTNNLHLAKAEVIKFIDSTKYDEDLWERYFYVLSLENDYKSILKLAKEAVTTVKESPIIWLYYGVAFYELKMYNEAVQTLSFGIKYSLKSRNLLEKYYSYLGECYNVLKDYSKSDFCFESSIKLNNKRYSVLCNYSYYLAQRNERLDKALSYIQDCLSAEPNNYQYLDTYGWILYKLNQQNEAQMAIEKSIENGGVSKKEVLMHYCYILVALNKFDIAKRFYLKLKELGYEEKQLKSILNE